MPGSRGEQLAWEGRWSRPAGVAALLSIVFFIASIVVSAQIGGGAGESEYLRDLNDHESARLVSATLQAIGVALLALPLYFLFTAARTRSDAVRGQLVGVVVVGPLFLAAASILSAISSLDAASQFVTDHVPRLLENGVPLNSDRADDLASDTLNEASLRPLAVGFGIGGQIGFVVGMFYTALQAMRTGLLTRFWGSLGMALGAVSFLFLPFTLLWYVYLGLLLLGWAPGGRPPAWETGEAMPWPTPGEKAAAEMEGGDEEGAGEDSPELPDRRTEGEDR